MALQTSDRHMHISIYLHPDARTHLFAHSMYLFTYRYKYVSYYLCIYIYIDTHDSPPIKTGSCCNTLFHFCCGQLFCLQGNLTSQSSSMTDSRQRPTVAKGCRGCEKQLGNNDLTCKVMYI